MFAAERRVVDRIGCGCASGSNLLSVRSFGLLIHFF